MNEMLSWQKRCRFCWLEETENSGFFLAKNVRFYPLLSLISSWVKWEVKSIGDRITRWLFFSRWSTSLMYGDLQGVRLISTWSLSTVQRRLTKIQNYVRSGNTRITFKVQRGKSQQMFITTGRGPTNQRRPSGTNADGCRRRRWWRGTGALGCASTSHEPDQKMHKVEESISKRKWKIQFQFVNYA